MSSNTWVYNPTTKPQAYTYYDANTSVSGILLPYSDKFLRAEDLNRQIGNAEKHQNHLMNQLSHRISHGGKTLRDHERSLHEQISWTSKRIDVLSSAQKFLIEHENNPDCKELLEHNSKVSELGKRFSGPNIVHILEKSNYRATKASSSRGSDYHCSRHSA